MSATQPKQTPLENDVANLLPAELKATGWRLAESAGKWRAKNQKLGLFSSACDYPRQAIDAARALAAGQTSVLSGDNGAVTFTDPDPPGSQGEQIRCPECGICDDLEPKFVDESDPLSRIESFTCPRGHVFTGNESKSKSAGKKKPATIEIPKDAFAFYVEPKYLDPSTTNARQIFDEEKLAELAASIADRGILEPLIVRPGKKAGRYEIVAGERRFRAAKIAKLSLIPCIVRKLSDAEAEEIQTIENDQREDLNPIERGAGYLKLIERHGHTPETLAAAVNKSKTFIYDQIKLAKLPDVAQQALLSGRIPQSTATLIARIPSEKLRSNAAEEIVVAKWREGEALSFRQAKSLIERRFSLQLKGTPFNREDSTLVPAAGACTNCPKLTGNNRVEFPDGRADVCTDPQCFNQKVAAHDARTRSKAKENLIKVLPASTTRALFNYYDSGIRSDSGYLDLSEQCPLDKQKKKRSYKQLLGEAAGPITVMAIDRKHRAHFLVPEKEAAKILERDHKIKIHVSAPRSAPSGRKNTYEDRYKAAEEKKRKTRLWFRPACVEAAKQLAETIESDYTVQGQNVRACDAESVVSCLLLAIKDGELYFDTDLRQRRGFDKKNYQKLSGWLNQAAFPQLAAFAFELIFWDGFHDYQAELSRESVALLEAYKIDFTAIANEAKEKFAETPAAKPKTKAKAAGGRGK